MTNTNEVDTLSGCDHVVPPSRDPVLMFDSLTSLMPRDASQQWVSFAWFEPTWQWLTSPTNWPVIVTVSGGIYALLMFRTSNRAKAAEVMLKLEEEYRKHIDILLLIENETTYRDRIEPLLDRVERERDVVLSNEDFDLLKRLESALRHFYSAYFAKCLGTDLGMTERAYGYYLRYLSRSDRAQLRDYVSRNWPSLSFWSECAGHPLPRRIWIRVKQIPRRLRAWWDPVRPGAFVGSPVAPASETPDSSPARPGPD